MPTVIDSLVVELGLDGRSMTAGTRKAQGDYKRLRDDATKTGKDLSDAGKRGAEFFTRMRNEALTFFAVFTAGKGLRAFVADTVSSNVALGNLARNLNTNVRTLDAWQRTARSFGASAGSISGLFQSMQEKSLTMSGRLELSRVQALTGVSILDQTTGRLRSMIDIMSQLNRLSQGKDPAWFQAVIGMLGGSQDAATVLEQQQASSRFRQMLSYAVTPQDVQSSQALLADWVRLTSQSEQLGRSFLTHVAPGFHAVLKNLSDWIEKHPEFQRALDRDGDAIAKFLSSIDWNKVSKAVDDLEKKVEGLDWKGIGTDLSALKGDLDDLTKLTGGWVNATELLFGLWAGSKFVSMLAGVRLLSGLLSAGPLGTLIGAAAVPAIGAAAGYTLVKGGSPAIGKDDTLAAGAGPAATEAAVRAEAQRQGVDPDAAVAITRIESGGRQVDAKGGTLTSSAGALGLFQLMPKTAAGLGVDPTNASDNIRGGVAYLKQLIARFHGNLEAVSAAYNAGPNNPGVEHYAETGDASQLPVESFRYAAKFATTLATLRHPSRRPESPFAKAGERIERVAMTAARHFDLSAFENTDSPVLYTKALLNVASTQPSGGNTTSHSTVIHSITVNTKATDPQGVARAVKSTLTGPQRLAAVGNTGLQ